MIEEDYRRFVAAADVTDDCRVEVWLRKAKQTVTASQARALAAELVRAAGEAERAAGELLRPVVPIGADVAGLGPDCRDGKCAACDGSAWDEARDEVVSCRCSCHGLPWSVA